MIELAAGTYGAQNVTSNAAAAASFSQNVVVRPAAGASVTMAGIQVYVPHLTVRSVTSTATLYLRQGANYSRFEYITTVRASAFIAGADNTALVRNRISPPDNLDGMQIKNYNADQPINTLIEGNIIGPGRRTDGSHVDCIQIFGGDKIVIRGNTIFDCSNAGIIAGNTAGGIMGDLRIERNFMRGCVPRTATCDGYYAIIIGSTASNRTTLVHNSISGEVHAQTPNQTFTAVGNIAIGITCTPAVNLNLVTSGNKCGVADRIGQASWVNATGSVPDLHLVANSAGKDVGSPHATMPDFDGQMACGPADLGADEHC